MNKRVSVIGIGRLGLCVALCLEEVGFAVLGMDINEPYVRALNRKEIHTAEPYVEQMLVRSTQFNATTSLNAALAFSDLILIYVATPLGNGDNYYDHTALGRVLMHINKERVHDKHIVIGSTVMPRYTTHIGRALLEDCTNTTLSYNPTFAAHGDIVRGITKPDLVLIGEETPAAGDMLAAKYAVLTPFAPIRRMSPISAEIAKLGLNCFLTTKIAFANLIADLAVSHPDAHAEDILHAIGTDQRVGTTYLKAGYGYGGPCFPRDNRALGVCLRQSGIEPSIPEATDVSNKAHTTFQAHRILEQMRANHDDWYILSDSACYKENCHVPIIEESQSLAIAKHLAQNRIRVAIEDTEEMIDAVRLEYGDMFAYAIK